MKSVKLAEIGPSLPSPPFCCRAGLERVSAHDPFCGMTLFSLFSHLFNPANKDVIAVRITLSIEASQGFLTRSVILFDIAAGSALECAHLTA